MGVSFGFIRRTAKPTPGFPLGPLAAKPAPMRIAFLGTPEFAVPALAELVAAGQEIAAVYAQPPAPRGRGQALKPSPVQAFAESLGLEVRTPASMRDPAPIAAFRALGLDAAVVVAFGQILPAEVLEAPRLGSFNLHASLLPRWRGAAPIQRAIMAGDAVTGVQVMRMTEGLDEGPVLRLGDRAHRSAGYRRRRARAAGSGRCAPSAARPGAGRARPSGAEAPGGWRARPTPARSGPPRRASTGPARRPNWTATSAACRPFPAPGSRRRRTRGRCASRPCCRPGRGRGRAGRRCWTTTF